MRRVEEIWKETREEILEKLLKDSNLQVPICQFQSSDADSFREHHLSDIEPDARDWIQSSRAVWTRAPSLEYLVYARWAILIENCSVNHRATWSCELPFQLGTLSKKSGDLHNNLKCVSPLNSFYWKLVSFYWTLSNTKYIPKTVLSSIFPTMIHGHLASSLSWHGAKRCQAYPISETSN